MRRKSEGDHGRHGPLHFVQGDKRTLGHEVPQAVAGLALAVGVPVLLALCWPGGWSSARLHRMVNAGLAAVALAAAGTFLLQGPYTAATGLGSVLDPSLLSVTLSSAAGWTLLARAALAGALALVLLPVRFERYEAVTCQLERLFKRYTDRVEFFSLDEASLEVTGQPHCGGSATRMASALRAEVQAGIDAFVR